MTTEEVCVKLAEVDARSKSNVHRIDRLEAQNEALSSMASSLAVVAEKQSNMSGQLDKLTGDVEEIKSEPKKRWDTVVTVVLTALVSGIIGYAVSVLIGG